MMNYIISVKKRNSVLLAIFLMVLIVTIILIIGNSKAPTLYNKPIQLITKDNTENPISTYNYKDPIIIFNGWEALLSYKQEDRTLGTNYQFELDGKQYKLYKDEGTLTFLDKIQPRGFFYKEVDYKNIEKFKEITKIYWYNEEKDPSKIGYTFTIQKTFFSTKPYFKLQLFAEVNSTEQLKGAGYGMAIKGYDIYLPNGKLLKNDHERIETNEPKDIILNGIKQDPTKPEFQSIIENKIILKGTNYKTEKIPYQIFYNQEKAIIIWGEFDYIDNLFKWEVFRPFFTKKESENTFKPLYLAILNEATLNYQNNTYLIDSKEFKGDINTLIKDWTF